MSSLWSQEEEARRRDFRQECVFTIDPETARVGVSVGVAMEMYNVYAFSLFTYFMHMQDLDDALHVKEVEKGDLFSVIIIQCCKCS